MIITESIQINAPLSVVWRVFSEIEDWETWNPVCQDCSLAEGGSLASGVCLTFTLKPYFIPIKITPRIVKCDPGREVIWAGGRMGIYAEHRFLFQEKNGGVFLTSIEKFRGFMLWVSRLMWIPSKLHQLTCRLLTAIKTQAETRACSDEE